MRHVIICFVFLLLCLSGKSQFLSFTVGVNGLTCSQCCRSVEMSLLRLPFVAGVEMNLEQTEGKITLKPGFEPNADRIAKAVDDAGFSVRFLKAELSYQVTDTTNAHCVSIQNRTYQLLEGSIKNDTRLNWIFVGINFMSADNYKNFSALLVPECNTAGNINYVIQQ